MKITNKLATLALYPVMEYLTDCGVVSLAYAANLTRDIVTEALGYKCRENYRDDIGTDTHWNHFATLDKLGIQWIKVTDEDGSLLVPGRTVLCLKLSTTVYHWVVLKNVRTDHDQYGNKYWTLICAMGNGKIGAFTFKDVFTGYIIPLPDDKEYPDNYFSKASTFDKVMSYLLKFIA